MMQSVAGPSLLTSVPIDEVLHDQDRVDLEKIAVAAVFHDLGIWTNKTFDYIAPSVALAAPRAVDSREIPHASADAVADGQTVIATGFGPDALVAEQQVVTSGHAARS
jgi:hypothetical protein